LLQLGLKVAQPVASSTTAKAYFLLPIPTGSLLLPASKVSNDVFWPKTGTLFVIFFYR
jgi:hypothetical protein